MAFTAQLGISDAQLANIELGLGPIVLNPSEWLPISLLQIGARGVPDDLGFSHPPPPFSIAATAGFVAPDTVFTPTKPIEVFPDQSDFIESPAPYVFSIAAPSTGFTPGPQMPVGTTKDVPFIPRDIDSHASRRAKRASEIISDIMNSLLIQKYIEHVSANPSIWKINALPPSGITGGVLTFNTRYGHVVLTVNDIITAFGPQNPYHFFGGPDPSFRYLNQIITGFGMPTVTAGPGVGLNATVSVIGTDVAGVITITTSNADTPSANAVAVTLNFQTAYPAPPFVVFMPSNANAWDLAVFPTPKRFVLYQSDVTSSSFILRSGTAPLPPAEVNVYTFNYMAIGMDTTPNSDGLLADDDITTLLADDSITVLTQG